MLETSIPLTCVLIFIANVIGLVGFCKCWFNVLFGINTKYIHIPVYDLTFKEILILSAPIIFLIISTFFVNYFL
jgi:hypothetical protein